MEKYKINFFKRIKQPKYEEVLLSVIKNYEDYINIYNNQVKNKENEKTNIKWKINIVKKQLELIKKGLCKIAVCNRYKKATYLYSKHKQGFYTKLEKEFVFKTNNFNKKQYIFFCTTRLLLECKDSYQLLILKEFQKEVKEGAIVIKKIK
ncbi:MAG: hypothetical protein ACRC0V_09880 [Fusobacteriaceae bacterium]